MPLDEFDQSFKGQVLSEPRHAGSNLESSASHNVQDDVIYALCELRNKIKENHVYPKFSVIYPDPQIT